MFSVELSKGFLDVSVEFLGSVLARFVDLSVIEKAIHLSMYWLLSMTTRAIPCPLLEPHGRSLP